MRHFQSMSAYVIRAHGKQTRNGGTLPYWVHCHNVAATLKRTLKKFREASAEQTAIIIAASYGHDLYEDTDTERQEIVSLFGSEVDTLIEALTNRHGDQKVAAYAEKFSTLPEAALLIKLADLLDNLDSSRQGYEDGHLDQNWMIGFLLPILEQQWQAIQTIKFQQFKKTADYLLRQVAKAFKRWYEAVKF